MNKYLSALIRKFLSPGERVALRQLQTEFRISRYHRAGMRQLRRQGWSHPAKINMGCGPHRKEGFLNIDLFPGGDLTLDLRRNLPFDSNCCEMIFSEHCFEHIDYPDTISHLFRECFRILKPGGMLRFSVPDTEWPLLDYGKGSQADYFRACMENSWHPAHCLTRLEHINYHFRQEKEHQYAYDEETARKILTTTGFQDIQRGVFDAALDSKHREIGSLFMSARKPA